MSLPAKSKPKAGAIPPGIEPGDHVYVRGDSGPMAVRVLAHGKDGMTGEAEDGKRHRITFDRYLGHKTRMLQRLKVIDQGADGALVEDDKGHRRYLAGHQPAVESSGEGASRGAAPARKDDPLLGGMGRLKKATMVFPDAVLFLKAEAPVFRPRVGHRVEFLSDAQTEKGPSSGHVIAVSDDGETATIRHSDHPGEVFRCADVQVMDLRKNRSSRNPDPLWMLKATLANRPGLALQDRTDKGGHQTKRWVRTAKDQPKAKPGKSDDDKPAMKHGDVVNFQHGDVQGSGKVVGSGADGVTVRDDAGREHQVKHEHLTGRAPDAEQPKPEGQGAPALQPGGDPPPLFTPEAVQGLPAQAEQPTKDRAELFAKSAEALDHLKTWLDREQGIASKMGFETVTTGMDGTDLTKPGGMLFIAPIKGEKRAAEKVESDYGGDWSKLLDTVRCSLAVDSFDQVQSTLAALQKGGMRLARQPKDRFHKPLPVGYRDLLLNVTFPNGIVGEVQVHVKPMLQAKEEGHKHYETERTLQSKKTGGDDGLTDEERTQLDASIHAQTAIYGNAWKTASGAAAAGAAAGGEMQKAMATPDKPDDYTYFDYSNAQFRRNNTGRAMFRSIDDVLIKGAWTPYKGKDPLAPALYGDEIPDPLAAPGDAATPPAGGDDAGGKQMAKAQPMILFLKGDGADPDRYSGSPDDEREDERNAKLHNMTVEEWKRTKADRRADAAGQRRLDKKEGLAKAAAPATLFLKAHIDGYTRKDGTFVRPHEDRRVAGKWGGDDRHLDEIMDIVGRSPHKHHALRVMTTHPQTGEDPDVEVGQKLGPSHRWNDGKATARALKGTSGYAFRNREGLKKAIKGAGSYFGRQVVLMGGDEARPGADAGEKLIADAKVLGVWHRKAEGAGRGLGIEGHQDHD